MMTGEPDLFSMNAVTAIDALEVTTTQRVVNDYWVVIDGTKFNAVDIFTTLRETCSDLSDSYISNQKMVAVLKKLRVIEHGGSGRNAMSAEKGPNYDHFMNWLKAKIPEEDLY